MKRVLVFTLVSLFFSSSFAQIPKSEFDKTVDSINAIIKANKLAYYINKQNSDYITKISVTAQGIVHFTDSISKPEMATIPASAKRKPVLISDCCPTKNSRTLDLFAIQIWDIHFPYADLKDKSNETLSKFLGFKKLDLVRLKEQFEKLKSFCKKNNQ